MGNDLDKDIERVRNIKYLTLSGDIDGKFVRCEIPEEDKQAIENVLSKLETWKKIAELLERKGDFSDYHDNYCNMNIFDCKEKNPQKSCSECIIDWARKEVENDFE